MLFIYSFLISFTSYNSQDEMIEAVYAGTAEGLLKATLV